MGSGGNLVGKVVARSALVGGCDRRPAFAAEQWRTPMRWRRGAPESRVDRCAGLIVAPAVTRRGCAHWRCPIDRVPRKLVAQS